MCKDAPVLIPCFIFTPLFTIPYKAYHLEKSMSGDNAQTNSTAEPAWLDFEQLGFTASGD